MERKAEGPFEALLMLADAVIITDERHRIIEANEVYEQVTGYPREDLLGRKASILRSGLTPESHYASMRVALSQQEPWSGVFTNRKRNGDIWHSHITITPMTINGTLYLVGVFRELEQLDTGVYLPEPRKKQLQTELLRILALSAEIQDPNIEDHLLRVQSLTGKLLRAHNGRLRLRLRKDYIEAVVNSSIMHDIGKAGIPEAILYKPGPLAHYERAIIEMHPLIGADLLGKITGRFNDELITKELTIAKNIVLHHHEKWDGSGYPKKLAGDAIPFEARVVSVVDVYDALTSNRPYKPAWEHGKALAYIAEQRGFHFDPELVDSFVEIVDFA